MNRPHVLMIEHLFKSGWKISHYFDYHRNKREAESAINRLFDRKETKKTLSSSKIRTRDRKEEREIE